jgi:hypothetical protein
LVVEPVSLGAGSHVYAFNELATMERWRLAPRRRHAA